ncbi:IS3 family transposase [Bacillus sp. ISL-35]|nr:IS3 family transposase [Bacillus sp. ISL-35]MBT2703351.1 IS3 family transposase [Chryseobacterium sp. ISL-80]
MSKRAHFLQNKITIIKALESGSHTISELVYTYKVAKRAIYNWVYRYEKYGVDGLKESTTCSFQYTHLGFKRRIDEAQMTQSMSRVGRCIDNSPMESFWGSLKSEKYYLEKYKTFEELSAAIDEYIYFYNHERYQKRLNGLSPLEFRAKAA